MKITPKKQAEILARMNGCWNLVQIDYNRKPPYLVVCTKCSKQLWKTSTTLRAHCSCDRNNATTKPLAEYLKRLHPSLSFIRREGKVFWCLCSSCGSEIRKWHDTLHKVCKCVSDTRLIKPAHLKKPRKKRNQKGTYQSYVKPRQERDIQFKLSVTLRNRLRSAVRLAIKSQFEHVSAVKNLGCTLHEFKLYMESLFQPGMNWNNWSKTGWHLDHIRPLSSFDLSDVEQAQRAVHYTNIQPLWAKDNLFKNDKYE